MALVLLSFLIYEFVKPEPDLSLIEKAYGEIAIFTFGGWPTDWDREGNTWLGYGEDNFIELEFDSSERLISFSFLNREKLVFEGEFHHSEAGKAGVIHEYGANFPKGGPAKSTVTFHEDGSVIGLRVIPQNEYESNIIYQPNGFKIQEVMRATWTKAKVNAALAQSMTPSTVQLKFVKAPEEMIELEFFDDDGIWDAMWLDTWDSDSFKFPAVVPPNGGTLQFRNANTSDPWNSIPVPAPVEGKVEIVEGG